MGKKVYAIIEGFNSNTNEKIENIIVDTWAECSKYVKGVKGAKYKSFEDINCAKKYLSEGSKLLKKGEDCYPEDCLHVYVDGSYNNNTERYSYGVVAVRNGVIEYIYSDSSKDSSKSNLRQIAGELEGAIKGVEYALRKGDEKVVIFHDYEGVHHHATGFWERREQSSVEYYNRMKELISEGIEVLFVKVDSHTGDLYNELVDEKCKEKLSIQSDKSIEKWLLKNIIKVDNEGVKQEILKIAPDGEKNIIIIDSNNIETKKESMENKFNEIVYEYNLNPEDCNRLIDKLSSKEKTSLINYLLEHARQI